MLHSRHFIGARLEATTLLCYEEIKNIYQFQLPKSGNYFSQFLKSL